MLKYKGYIGKVEFDAEDEILHGTVINTRATISFEGDSVAEIKQSFKDAIDDYLEICQEMNEEPEKPFSGKFVLRLTPEQHRYATLSAQVQKKSLNQWITNLIEGGIHQTLPFLSSPSESEIIEMEETGELAI